jgi:hypothetical protein
MVKSKEPPSSLTKYFDAEKLKATKKKRKK